MTLTLPVNSINSAVNGVTVAQGSIIRTGPTNNLFVTSSLIELGGNVGIGTAGTLNARLVVNGAIVSRSTLLGGANISNVATTDYVDSLNVAMSVVFGA